MSLGGAKGLLRAPRGNMYAGKVSHLIRLYIQCCALLYCNARKKNLGVVQLKEMQSSNLLHGPIYAQFSQLPLQTRYYLSHSLACSRYLILSTHFPLVSTPFFLSGYFFILQL